MCFNNHKHVLFMAPDRWVADLGRHQAVDELDRRPRKAQQHGSPPPALVDGVDQRPNLRHTTQRLIDSLLILEKRDSGCTV